MKFSTNFAAMLSFVGLIKSSLNCFQSLELRDITHAQCTYTHLFTGRISKLGLPSLQSYGCVRITSWITLVDANEHVGNVDTLVDDANIDNKCDKVFTFAPGEGQHPLSLYQDKDVEYLCFPTILGGHTPPSRDERLVPVHYSDIVKWELRSVDRRAAQSVPNIFFKHKKLQMKQISDKVNLAVRRCKKDVKRSQQLKPEIRVM